jgi:hypothetical protein
VPLEGKVAKESVDHEHLLELRRRQSLLRDRVRGVAMRLHPGVYLAGPAGVGKTHVVLETLRQMDVGFQYHRGHLTPMGLFDLLAENSDRTVVLDDVSHILSQQIALQLLLAALGHTIGDGVTRIVKYRRQGRSETVYFEGGLVCISNLELHPTPLLQALKSRVHYLAFDPSDDQIAALMHEIAASGWPADAPVLTPDDCVEVTDFLINESRRLGHRLDLRALVDKALPDRLQWESGNAESHWKDLVLSVLQERVGELKHTPLGNGHVRQSRREAESQIVQNLLATYPSRTEQLAAWSEQTGKSARCFYRRLGEIK